MLACRTKLARQEVTNQNAMRMACLQSSAQHHGGKRACTVEGQGEQEASSQRRKRGRGSWQGERSSILRLGKYATLRLRSHDSASAAHLRTMLSNAHTTVQQKGLQERPNLSMSRRAGVSVCPSCLQAHQRSPASQPSGRLCSASPHKSIPISEHVHGCPAGNVHHKSSQSLHEPDQPGMTCLVRSEVACI